MSDLGPALIGLGGVVLGGAITAVANFGAAKVAAASEERKLRHAESLAQRERLDAVRRESNTHRREALVALADALGAASEPWYESGMRLKIIALAARTGDDLLLEIALRHEPADELMHWIGEHFRELGQPPS